MKINGNEISFKQILFLCLYYGFARHLPSRPSIGRKMRYWCCKHIFKSCGKNVNIERGAYFGTGAGITMGDFACLGKNCNVPDNITLGNEVMMGPNVTILDRNHRFERTDIPMGRQGDTERRPVVIENDVWIGCQVLIMPGRTIKTGSIIAGGCVLCKDFPEYSIVGGNPSKLIRSRK
ncbi:MAG: acyltransferase [Bacteroidaceae bacterium]|nr:acyltransferase [Bacteroidaceae bacterium]